jgi:four helix bundle protein
MAPEKISSFTQLRTWQNSRVLAVEIYRLTKQFPPEEKFGLSSQIRRSAVSVSANIAEGFSRSGTKEKIQFYTIALGSLTETLSHAYIACDLDFLPQNELKSIEEKVIEIQKMTNGLIKSAGRRNP